MVNVFYTKANYFQLEYSLVIHNPSSVATEEKMDVGRERNYKRAF